MLSCLFAAELLFSSLSQGRVGKVLFDTPSWCDGSSNHHTTPPTVDDVHDEAVVLVGLLSVGVEALILVDTDVRCLGCTAEGVEVLKDDEAVVGIVDCCPDGVEVLTLDDVVVAAVVCRTGVAAVAEVVVDLSCRSCCNSVDDQC